MAGDDKTAALVVALSAQLTKFERDMKRAGDIADRTVNDIEDKFSKANPTFKGSFFGNLFGNLTTKGLEAAINVVGDLTDRFLELQKVSKLVGESMQDVFGIQQAASGFKVPVEDATASVKGLGVLLDQLQRGEKNSLSDLFDANPQALQGINRDALTLQQTFEIVANLVQNARTEIQKIDIARAAGQAETMVRFLEQGGEAFSNLSKNAAATAPDLQRLADGAKAFDDAWQTAVKNVKSYLSENLFDIIKTDLQDIISLLGGAVRFLQLFKGGLIDASTQSAAADLDKFRNALVNFKNAREQVDESAGLDTSANGRRDRRLGVDSGPRQTGTATRDPNAPLSNVPRKETGGGDTQDSFDRTEEAITRHTASLKADTIAVSQNQAVQAQLRAEFQLLNAIRKDEGEVTQEQIDRYTQLRATMEAQQALEASGIQLTTAHRDALLAASEGAKAAQAGYIAAADGVAKLNQASSTLGSALSSAFADAIVEGKSLNEVFKSLIKTLEKAAINSAFASIFNQQAGGGLAPFASLLSGIGRNAEGTNNWRGGLTWVGERGPEIVNLPRGSQVIPNAAATRMSSGSPIYNNFNVAGDVSPGTIDRLQAAVVAANRKADGLAKAFTSTQRMNATGVG